MAANDPRMHHYIPQAYLRGFGWKRGPKQWYIHAMDLKQLRRFQPNIKNVCTQRDFMRVDVEGYEPYILEAEMSKFETQAREAILRVVASRKFEGEDRNWVLNLMALFAVRHPEMRENMRDFQERVLKQVLSLNVATKERWEASIARMKEEGVPVDPEITYEQVKDFHERGEYKINVPRERHIETETKLHATVLELLAKRNWRLMFAGGAGTFATSDHPVVLVWDNPKEVPFFVRHSPGYGLKNTEVLFPMTSKCALLGRFDGEESVEEVNDAVVGHCNTRTFGHAFDYAFCQEEKVPYIIPPDYIFFDDRYMEKAKAYHDANPPKELKEGEIQEWNKYPDAEWPLGPKGAPQ